MISHNKKITKSINIIIIT